MSNQSVIKYNLSFKKADLVKVKLKTIEPVCNTKLEELCAFFDQGGIEKLLYVIKDFQISFEALELDINDYNTVKTFYSL